MSNAVNLMAIRLQAQMLEKLNDSLKNSGNNNDTSGTSFSDALQNALSGDSLSTNQLTSNVYSASELNAMGFDALGTTSTAGTSSVSSGTATEAGGMSVSENMVKFIERHEGFSSTGYRGVDSWNVTTGYGHVVQSGENFGTLTQSSAENLLKSDLKSCEASVNKEFAGTKLTQSQFDSLTSFAMGLGTNIWSQTPKLVSDIKSGASAGVIKQDFENCSKCGGEVCQGLVNRRDAEAEVFNYGNYNA